MSKPFAIDSFEAWFNSIQPNPLQKAAREAVESPFDMPDFTVIFQRVYRADILDYLRSRVNKGYMPSATGETVCNSKPEYLRHADPLYPSFPQLHSHSVTDFYAFDTFENPTFPKNICYYLQVRGIGIYVNLLTEQILVRRVDTTPMFQVVGPWLLWESEEKSLSIDLMAFNFC